jgi:O-antigen/teichoic acid export membrane protein
MKMGVRAGRLLRNSGFALIGVITPQVVNILLFLLAARQSGAAEAGAYALAVKYANLFLPISLLGLEELMTREVARDHSTTPTYLVNFGLLRLLSGFIFYGLLWLVAGVFISYTPDTTYLILLFGLTIIPSGLNQLSYALFAAHEQQGYSASVILLTNLIGFGFGWLALWRGMGLTALVLARLAMAWIGLVMNVLLVRRCLLTDVPQQVLRVVAPGWLWRQIQIVLPFTLMVLFYTVEWQIDAVILSVFRSQAELAYYYAAYSILTFYLLVINAYRTAVLPVMARLYVTARDSLGRLHDRSFLYLSLLVLPLAAGTALFAPQILFLFGTGFPLATGVLRVLMVALVIVFLNAPNSRLMIAAERQRQVAFFLGLSMGANVIANLTLVPTWGALGAAAARVVSVLAFSLPNAWYVFRHIRRHNPLRGLPRPILATALMCGAMMLLARLMPWWLAAGLGGGLYAVALLALGGLPVAEVQHLGRAILRSYSELQS